MDEHRARDAREKSGNQKNLRDRADRGNDLLGKS
jgi:hypothetical protein